MKQVLESPFSGSISSNQLYENTKQENNAPFKYECSLNNGIKLQTKTKFTLIQYQALFNTESGFEKHKLRRKTSLISSRSQISYGQYTYYTCIFGEKECEPSFSLVIESKTNIRLQQLFHSITLTPRRIFYTHIFYG